MANKKYIAIITEETDDFSLDYLTDNPWEGKLRDIAKGNTVDELVKDASDFEGMFYQLYETDKGRRLGYGIFNYEAIEEDINRSKTKQKTIDGRFYMVMTVSQLADYVISNLCYEKYHMLTDAIHNFINCDFCVIDGYDEDMTIEEIKNKADSWHGIKAIDTGFDNANLDIVCDYYGGGCLAYSYLNCDMSKNECWEDIIQIILESLDENGNDADNGTLLFVEVLGMYSEVKSNDK